MVFKPATAVLIIIANIFLCCSAIAQSLPSEDLYEAPVLVSDRGDECLIEPELQALLDLHNQSRQDGLRCGVFFKSRAPSLRWSCELAVASKVHADDMADNDFLAHKGSDGSTFSERATQAGFEWLNVSENIAHGYELPEKVYRVWVSSRAHCKNISSQKYQEFGAAKVDDYWVVMFGRR